MTLAEVASRAAPTEVAAPRWANVLGAAPELVAAGIAGFSAPLMFLLLIGDLNWPLAFPLGAAGALAAAVFCGTSVQPVSRQTARLTAVAALVVLAWVVLNSFFSAQDLYAHRDPATYDLAGRWLMNHTSLKVQTHAEVFGSPVAGNDQSAGFADVAPGQIAAQGNHLLPILLAAIGRIFGVAGLMKANVLFGGCALFALFGAARRFVGARLALLVMTAMAVSIPMLYVSRDTFSEPLALLFLMAGLIFLHRALAGGPAQGRLRDFALAGFVTCASAMVRIDAYAAMIALVVVAVAAVAVAPAANRRAVLARMGCMLGAGLVPAVLGYLDVSHLSQSYYHLQRHDILLLIAAAGGVAALGVLATGWLWLRTSDRLRLVGDRWRATAASWAAIAVVGAFGVFASRPLFMTGHGTSTPYLAQVQQEAGAAVDPTRTYNELTVAWQALYFGWATVILAVVGYVLLVRRLILAKDWLLAGLLVMGLSLSALYLWSSQITPDQPWAARRYVPVVMPILLVAAAYAIRALARTGGLWRRRLAAVAAVGLVGYPLVVTAPAFGLREEVPQLAQVQAVCRAVAPGGALLTVDYNTTWSYQQTFRAYCGVPTLGLEGATPTQLAQARLSVLESGRTLYVISTDPSQIHFVSGATTQPFSTTTTTRWPSTLQTIPSTAAHETVTLYLGVVGTDGLAVPVGP